MSIFKRKEPRVGDKVGVVWVNLDKNQDEIKVGKIIATRYDDCTDLKLYLVRVDGKVKIYKPYEIWTGWREE